MAHLRALNQISNRKQSNITVKHTKQKHTQLSLTGEVRLIDLVFKSIYQTKGDIP